MALKNDSTTPWCLFMYIASYFLLNGNFPRFKVPPLRTSREVFGIRQKDHRIWHYIKKYLFCMIPIEWATDTIDQFQLKMIQSFLKKTKSLLRPNEGSCEPVDGPICQAMEAISLDQTFNCEDPEELRQTIYGMCTVHMTHIAHIKNTFFLIH